MEELSTLVTRARTGDVGAFGEVVSRFQDMAVGYGYSLLGDFHLAQDAAQEAFLEAYRDLPNLREPAAFPGWFRKIAFKHCDRITRRRRVATVPLEAAAVLPAEGADPADVAQRRELRESVLAAIRSLPDAERETTTLFYIDGYSQQDIAGFLEVPVGTVKSRLHAARNRLKEKMLAMAETELKSQRPGPELQQLIVAELRARRDRFDAAIRRSYRDGDFGQEYVPDPSWAEWWHERRMEDVRANAAQYGIEPDETLPRMLPEYQESGTYRDDFKDLPRRWGLPEGTRVIYLRDLCRDAGVAPLAVLRWEAEGLPVLRYDPWIAYDKDRSAEWIRQRSLCSGERMTPVEAKEPLLLTLRALAVGKASAAEALSVFHALESCALLGPDPLWENDWAARRPTERLANARLYGLSEPAANWFGAPPDVLAGDWSRMRVFEIRDLTRRLGLSPFDVIRWTRDGMPCLRRSPEIRWDMEHVAAWVAERNLLPKREYTAKELDGLAEFVIQAVAAGDEPPEDGRDALACWVGVM